MEKILYISEILMKNIKSKLNTNKDLLIVSGSNHFVGLLYDKIRSSILTCQLPF